MTIISRKTIRDEIVAALSTALTGSGKPVSSVYGYQIGKLSGESPVVLVLSRSTERRPAGVGAKKFNNTFELELQVLVYDGLENNPLTACAATLASKASTDQPPSGLWPTRACGFVDIESRR